MKWLGPTWISVDLDGLTSNLAQVKKLTSASVCAVVKGDAYGHGIRVVSQVYAKHVKYLAVNDISEALEIREDGLRTPILILSPSLPQQAYEIAKYNLTATVGGIDLIKALALQGQLTQKIINVHLKVDTGMNRVGILPNEAVALANHIKKQPFLRLEGVFTHFASANQDLKFTKLQLAKFRQLKESMEAHGFTNILWHSANSSALINLPESHLDMVRVGTLLYGQSTVGTPETLHLNNTWELYSRIIQVKTVPKGQSIGYGRSYTTKRNSVIGIIPIGYGDGLGVSPSRNSSWGNVHDLLHRLLDKPSGIVIDDHKYPIIGRVAMGMSCIDLTDHPNGLNLYGAIVRIPTRRVLVNRRLPKVYLRNKKVSLIYFQNKIWKPQEKDGQVFFKDISNWG